MTLETRRVCVECDGKVGGRDGAGLRRGGPARAAVRIAQHDPAAPVVAAGIFAPALSAGAAIGGFIAQWFEPSRGQFNLLVLAGMTAFLTGVTRSPFTSAILVLEMTDRHSAIFQLMYAAMMGYLIAFAFDRKSYYERMKLRFLSMLPNYTPEPVPEEEQF